MITGEVISSFIISEFSTVLLHPVSNNQATNKVVKSQIFFMFLRGYYYKTSIFQNIEHGHGAHQSFLFIK
jgi:hypothetical protein